MAMAEARAGPPPVAAGDVVASLKGRDRGTVALVWGILGRERVAIVDGDVHPLARPKAKNRRHLELIGHAPEMAHRMAQGQPVSDGDVQAALAPFRQAATETAGEGGSGDGQGG
jgi:large subunit ribosomal protein L14e